MSFVLIITNNIKDQMWILWMIVFAIANIVFAFNGIRTVLSRFLYLIYEIIMAIIWEVSFCNSWEEAIHTPVKKW
jgi:succinate dehydrogenase hydrophobic anchor subunit